MACFIDICPTCNGRGSLPGPGPAKPENNPPHMPAFIPRVACPTCNGSGEVLKEE